MTSKNVDLARYNALIQLWTHHSSAQLQWPAAVTGAALLVISSIIPENIPKLTDINAWGHDAKIIFGVGVPLIITSLGIIAMIYIMKRARKAMMCIEESITKTEKQLGQKSEYLQGLNHPKGFSGPNFMRFYMIICFALPMSFFGLSFSFGLISGAISWVCILLAWLFLELKN